MDDDPPLRRARQTIPDGGRRIQALRLLLGYRTPAEFAKQINIVGLGRDTIIDIESPSRPRMLWDYEANSIADAAGVPRSFFTAPLERLGDVGAPG